QWARQQGIPVGPGRGSGAGSVVAWALTITDLDPIRFQLIFERFLNPERVSMPYFDIDFCQERRDEVIRYVCEKHGSSCVAHIITFGKLQARAVLRDVGRVLEMSYGHVDKICKMIPNNPANPVTLEQALEMEPLLRQARDDDPRVEQLIEVGMKLEGLYRHASTHAAGIVIGGAPLVEMVPLYKDERSALPVTQFSMKYVEMAGLLKFDFLGLKTLTVIDKCCALIRARGIDIEILDIPLDDPATYALLVRVEAVGVFQLESAGMRDVLRRLRPDQFEDLIALVALYRPGPMDDIPRYLACKHGEEAITYLHPALQDILESTYGVMVYQEQVMRIAQVLGGYSLGAADLLRRAMGKKIKSEMADQRARFVDGATANGVDRAVAKEIFNAMAKFAGYGFNKSHAAPYALLSYQTAYLKANYPLEFFAASMTYEQSNTDKLMVFRQDLQRLKIPLYPPDINASQANFTVEGEGIRYALGAIKNVGEQAMQELVRERRRGGPFKDIRDFILRMDAQVINKRQLEGLVAAGAFDSVHKNRQQLFVGADVILKHANMIHDEKKRKQGSLFGGFAAPQEKILLPTVEEWSHLEGLNYEFQALGFFLSSHPLDAYSAALKRLQCVDSSYFIDGADGSYRLAGVILTKQERTSKIGQRFAFVQCSDGAGFFEVAIFSEVFVTVRSLLQPGKVLLFQVSARRDGDVLRLTAQDVQLLEDVLANTSQKLQITASANIDLGSLQSLLAQMPSGKTEVQIHLQLSTQQAPAIITLPATYAITAEVRERLGQIAGVEEISNK
ncbi:MAG: DNA polymerase III subunit alpha, partial [Alphaproteobacteria bacterium]